MCHCRLIVLVCHCLFQEIDGKIGSLVLELQKKRRALEQEHTETQMVQVSILSGH